jgi:hypothetical protein
MVAPAATQDEAVSLRDRGHHRRNKIGNASLELVDTSSDIEESRHPRRRNPDRESSGLSIGWIQQDTFQQSPGAEEISTALSPRERTIHRLILLL